MDHSHNYRKRLRTIRKGAVALEAVLGHTRARISRLRKFYNEGERHFNTEFNNLKKKTDHLTQEEWDNLGDFYIEEHYELEELRELKRNFSIVGLFTVFEAFLQGRLRQLHRASPARPKRNPKTFQFILRKLKLLPRVCLSRPKRDPFGRMTEEFSKLGVRIAKGDRDWQTITGMAMVRHCIVHSGGRIDKKRTKKLANYKIPVVQATKYSWRIKLSDRYFEETAGAVERACKRIAKDCQDAINEKRVKV